MNEPRELSSVFAAFLKTRKRQRRVDRAREAWMAVAGEDLTTHTRVRSLLRGVLTIEVDSPPLCHRLAGFEKDQLLLAIKAKPGGGEVSDLKFRHGAFTE
jgi:hypothetical protein